MTNVFSVREPSAKTDGTTKETAICFSKARTQFEAMKMAYKYLESRGIDLEAARRHNEGFEGQFLFEYWDTPEGKIWFKFDIGKAPMGIFSESEATGVGLESVKRDEPKVGRNDPCPCGSGKKFKKCCGR